MISDHPLDYVSPEPNTGCWLWMAACDPKGYGLLSVRGADGKLHGKGAHRFIYELLRGPVPNDLHLDHLCRTPTCVNPDHLEPVTPAENTRRSPIAQGAINGRKTHCVRGHSLDDDSNVLRPHGKKDRRVCRPCHMERVHASRQRQRAVRIPKQRDPKEMKATLDKARTARWDNHRARLTREGTQP